MVTDFRSKWQNDLKLPSPLFLIWLIRLKQECTNVQFRRSMHSRYTLDSAENLRNSPRCFACATFDSTLVILRSRLPHVLNCNTAEISDRSGNIEE